MRGEVPGLGGEVLQGDVLDLRSLADEELGDGVRVAGELGRGGRVLLDDAEAALGLGDDERPPEERSALARVRDPNVERLFEHKSLRNLDEQAVLPERGIVSRELLVRADERPEQLVVAQRLEGDSFGRALDLDPVLANRGQSGHVEVKHAPRSLGRGLTPDMTVGDKGVGVEALQVGETPRLVGRGRQGKRAVALEQVSPGHRACTADGG